MLSLAGMPVYALRRAFGIKAKRSSAYNACIGAQLRGKSYSTPAPGMGGRRDARIQSAFTQAAKSCAK